MSEYNLLIKNLFTAFFSIEWSLIVL